MPRITCSTQNTFLHVYVPPHLCWSLPTKTFFYVTSNITLECLLSVRTPLTLNGLKIYCAKVWKGMFSRLFQFCWTSKIQKSPKMKKKLQTWTFKNIVLDPFKRLKIEKKNLNTNATTNNLHASKHSLRSTLFKKLYINSFLKLQFSKHTDFLNLDKSL